MDPVVRTLLLGFESRSVIPFAGKGRPFSERSGDTFDQLITAREAIGGRDVLGTVCVALSTTLDPTHAGLTLETQGISLP